PAPASARSSSPRAARGSSRGPTPSPPGRPRRDGDVTTGDVPLLERLAQLPAVPVSELLGLLQALAAPGQDPVVGPLFGTDDEGDATVNPLLPAVLQQFQGRQDLTCYAALLEGLTGIWNAAVRAAVVARLRATGLPQDDLLIRLQALSPTLGFAQQQGDWARQWLSDPFAQDTLL